MKNPLLEFIQRYGPAAGEGGPVLMVQEIFGKEPDRWQEIVLNGLGRGERHIAVRSCHGVGKTAVAAWGIIYRLLFCYPQKTVVTSPTSAQLYDALVPEVLKWFRMLPVQLQELYTIKSDRIELSASPEQSFFTVRTSRAESPEALQGIHCDPGYVLLIGDEASGIPESVYEAAAGSMSGHNCTTLLIGNPVRTTGFFFDIFHRPGFTDEWLKVHVSHRDSPRVTDEFVKMMAQRYGEDSNAFRVRCLGEFPRADDDTLIPYMMVAEARERDIVVPKHLPRVWGVDVARFGEDSSALVVRNNRAVLEPPLIWSYADTMESAGRVKAKWDQTPDTERPRIILVDVIGMGAGVVDRLFELGLPVRGVNVAESAASNADQYLNARSELWWKAREWFISKEAVLPKRDPSIDARHDPMEKLIAQLTSPKYRYTSTGRLQVEAKSDIKKRLGLSPDVADAFVLTFAEDLATMIHGTAHSPNWNQPILRDLAVV